VVFLKYLVLAVFNMDSNVHFYFINHVNMEQIILSGISLNDFLEKIDKLIETKLHLTKPAGNKQSNYLGRKEVCKLLQITLPTLNDWSKLGRLQSYKIGNRVLYKKQEVENSLHQVSSIKFKKG
jgi:excisionase family DNA binding protein